MVGDQIKIEALGGQNIGCRKSPLMAAFFYSNGFRMMVCVQGEFFYGIHR